MSNAIMNLDTYKDICDAVREKTSETSTYTAPELPNKIRNISTGGGIPIDVNVDIEGVTHLSNYPDLSNLQTSNGEVYFVFDNRYNGWYSIIPSGGTSKVELGHIENNVFVSDTVINASLASGGKALGYFSDLNCTDEFPIIRLTNTSLTYWAFINGVSINGASHNALFCPIVEIIADVPSFVGAAATTTNVRLTTYVEKVTLKNFSTRCTNISGMFGMGYNLREINLVNCDFSNVISLEYLFYHCNLLEEIDLGMFGTTFSKVRSLGSTFNGCFAVKTIDLSCITSTVITSLTSLFYNCYSLENIIGYKNLDVSNVVSFNYLFNSCRCLKEIDLSNWQITNKCANMQNVFSDCFNLSTLKLGNNWDMSNVPSLNYFFSNCFTLQFTPELKSIIENWNFTKISNISFIFSCCYLLNGELDLSGWVFVVPTNGVTLSGAFRYCYSITKITLPAISFGNISNIFEQCRSLTEIVGLDGCNTNKSTGFNNVFAYCYSLKNIDLSFITNTSLVTSMAYMFYHCQSLEEVVFPNITYDTSNLTDMSYMFQSCSNLKNVSISFTNTNAAMNCKYMFDDSRQLDSISTALDFSKCGTYTPTTSSCCNVKSFTYNAAPKINWDIRYFYNMPKTEIVRILNTLPTVTSKTLTLTQLKGKLTDEEKAIATSKGWTIA